MIRKNGMFDLYFPRPGEKQIMDEAYFQRRIELDGNVKHLPRKIIIDGNIYKLGCTMMIPVRFKNKSYEKQFVKVVGLHEKYYSLLFLDDDDCQHVEAIDASCFVLIGDLKKGSKFKIYVAAREEGEWSYAYATKMTGQKSSEETY